ncbi:MAG: FHA domain-containing protein, partial [Planctomycetota bacterium]
MHLIVTSNGVPREYFPDPSKQQITLGRTPGNDLILMDEKAASRKHATIEATPQGWKVVDQMSSNGTCVNGEKQNFAFLADGDVISIGKTTIKVVLAPVPGAQAAAGAGVRLGSGSGHMQDVRKGPAPARMPDNAPVSDSKAVDASGAGAERQPVFHSDKKNPLVGLAIAASALLLVGGIGYFVVTNGSQAPQPTAEIPTEATRVETSEADTELIAKAKKIANGDSGAAEKFSKLHDLSRQVKGLRGDIAYTKIYRLEQQQFKKLDKEIRHRVTTDLRVSLSATEGDNHVLAVQTMLDLEEWPASSSVLEDGFAAYKLKAGKALDAAKKANTEYVDDTHRHATQLSYQNRFNKAADVMQELLDNAWLTVEDRQSYERIKADFLELHAKASSAPVVKEPKEQPKSILDKVKKAKDDGRLPGKNKLLRNGKRSEIKLMAALQTKLIDNAKAKTLTDMRWSWIGQTAEIFGADTKKLKMRVSKIDKKTGEEISYTTALKWNKLSPEDLLTLYDRIPELDATDLFAITLYCYDNSMMDEASHRAFSTYQARNEWKSSIDTLIASKRRIKIPVNGFVEHGGMLVTPDEKEDAIFMDNLRGVLERFQKGIGHREKRKRDDSEAAFQELIGLGARAVKPSIVILRGVLDEETKNAKKATGLLAGDTSQLDALMTELDKRRDYAMELIMDTKKYPYPYAPNQAEVQAEVNERVAAVREIWNNPASFTGQSNPQLESVMSKIQAIATRMAQIDPAQQYYKETPEETVEYIKNIANDKLSIKNYTGDDLGKQKVYNYNVKALEHNKDFPTGDGHCDSDGRAQVAVTNDYRIMFGLHALKINDK